MRRLLAILIVLASIVLVAPVIESGTAPGMKIFQAVGNAEDSGGGW